jgi:hypothetical protein
MNTHRRGDTAVGSPRPTTRLWPPEPYSLDTSTTRRAGLMCRQPGWLTAEARDLRAFHRVPGHRPIGILDGRANVEPSMTSRAPAGRRLGWFGATR